MKTRGIVWTTRRVDVNGILFLLVRCVLQVRHMKMFKCILLNNILPLPSLSLPPSPLPLPSLSFPLPSLSPPSPLPLPSLSPPSPLSLPSLSPHSPLPLHSLSHPCCYCCLSQSVRLFSQGFLGLKS